MKVTPLQDRVLVRRLEEGEQKVGGIIIPDTAKEKPQQGQVVAVGKGRVNHEGQRIALAVQVDDRILFGKYAQEITLAGETYVILRDKEVLAVLGSGGTTPKKRVEKTPSRIAPKTNAKRKPRPALKAKTIRRVSKKKTRKK
jgi:chaperonin GroES